MAKNINEEIDKLLYIRDEVYFYTKLLIADKNVRIISKDKFNQWMNENKLDEDIIYCIVDPEIGQYIEGYIEQRIRYEEIYV